MKADKTRSFFCLLFLGFLSINSLGYNWHVQQSPISSSLQQPTVSAIFHDNLGLLWIGTQHGLYVFDGSEHTFYGSGAKNEFWLPSSDIKEIGQREDGEIIVVTENGKLLQSNTNKRNFRTVSVDKSNEDVKVLRVISSGNGVTYIITNSGLYIWKTQSISRIGWLENGIFSGGKLSAVRVNDDESEIILIGNRTGLVVIDLETKTAHSINYRLLALPDARRVTAIGVKNSNLAVAGTSDGEIFGIDLKTRELRSHNRISRETSIFISEISFFQGAVIVATDRGLYKSDIELQQFERIKLNGSKLSSPDIYSTHQAEDQIWVGTANGLDIISFSTIALFNERNSGVYDDILSFAEDSIGNVWVGTYGGLFKLDSSTGRHSKVPFTPFSSHAGDERVTAIYSDSDELWIGHLQGSIKTHNTVNGDVKDISLKNASAIATTRIVGSRSDQAVWISTYESGLIRAIRSDGKIALQYDLIPEDSVHAIFQSKQGSVLAASDERIYKYDPRTNLFEELVFDYGGPHSKPVVYSFAETNAGDILVGTKDQGLYTWSKDNQRDHILSLYAIPEDRSASSSTIYEIQIDNSDNIWCSTENGILKIDSSGQLIQRFTQADGLQGNDFNLGASFKDSQGRLYFGGANGYNRFDPREVKTTIEPSPMIFTGFTVPNGRIDNIHGPSSVPPLELSHDDYFITFHFSVLDFATPKNNKYRYQLVGYDKQWIDNRSQNTATYTNLPSGDYIFRAQGANSRGIWNTDGISVMLHKQPPPWLNGWAFYVYGLLLSIIGWACCRIYNSYAIERRSHELVCQVYETENEADDDLHEFIETQDKLMAAATAHNKVSLDIVEYCIDSQGDQQTHVSSRELANGSLKRIDILSRLKHYTRYEPEGVQIDLHSFVDAIIDSMLQKTQVKPESVISINEIEERYLPSNIAIPLGIIIFELLENSFLHAFGIESPANYVHLKMAIEGKHRQDAHAIDLSITDSGEECPQDLLENCKATSGIAIVKALVRRLGGNIIFDTGSSSHIRIVIPEISVQ